MPFAEDKLRDILRSQRLKSVQEVLEIYGNGIGCEVCKPALSYMLDMLWCGDHDEDRSARFINDRVHANIQKDGTFSVVPRIRGGVTSPDELRRIADVADKYQVPMVKITGSQRIDLLGIKKADLPKVWADLGMPSGQAYTKGVRMVKTCVGTEFCRFGTQDSTARRHRDGAALRAPLHAAQGEDGGGRLPAQLRRGDGQGHRPDRHRRRLAGGGRRRGRQVACARPTCSPRSRRPSRRSRPSELFFQYYRENANYLERTYDFVERLGIEKVRKETVYAPDAVRDGAARSAAQVEGARARRLAGRARRRCTRRSSFRFAADGEGARMSERRWIRVTTVDNIPPREGRAVLRRRPRAGASSISAIASSPSTTAARTRAARSATASSPAASVVCPLHAWKVNLETGAVERPRSGTEHCVRTYPTRVEDGVVA